MNRFYVLCLPLVGQCARASIVVVQCWLQYFTSICIMLSFCSFSASLRWLAASVGLSRAVANAIIRLANDARHARFRSMWPFCRARRGAHAHLQHPEVSQLRGHVQFLEGELERARAGSALLARAL